MKTKKKKKITTKQRPRQNKKKPIVRAIAAAPEYFRVDVEVPHRKTDGTTEYTYILYNDLRTVTEETAKNVSVQMKGMGLGGRIVHLDGTPDGKVTLTWGNVEREAEAEKIEKAALEGK